jgi:hypothetical protein
VVNRSTLQNVGNVTVNGNIDNNGTLTQTGNVVCAGTLAATGAVTARNNLAVLGNADVTGTLTQTGNLTVAGTTESTGAITGRGALNITGNTILTGKLSGLAQVWAKTLSVAQDSAFSGVAVFRLGIYELGGVTAVSTGTTATAAVTDLDGGLVTLGDAAQLYIPESLFSTAAGLTVLCTTTAATATVIVQNGVNEGGSNYDVITLEANETVLLYFAADGSACYIKGGYGFALS